MQLIRLAANTSERGGGSRIATLAQLQHFSKVGAPYITDAGAACGANINAWGANAGITVVAAAQLADTITSPLGTGWFDSAGLGIGAKCIFNSGTTNISFGGGATGFYVVSPLWSNAVSGCALQ
jgi:serine protease